MEITTTLNEAEKNAEFQITGRINTITAPDLENTIAAYYAKCDKMILDFTAVDFISSAGLRVLMDAEAAMRDHGTLILKGVTGSVREVLDMTGFIDFLKIE